MSLERPKCMIKTELQTHLAKYFLAQKKKLTAESEEFCPITYASIIYFTSDYYIYLHKSVHIASAERDLRGCNKNC